VCREPHEPGLSVQGVDHAAATPNEIRNGSGGIGMCPRHDLDLRRRELRMEPVIVREQGQELGGDRAQRMRPVDQQQLLLDSDGERLGSIERAAEGLPMAWIGGTSDLRCLPRIGRCNTNAGRGGPLPRRASDVQGTALSSRLAERLAARRVSPERSSTPVG